MFTTFSVYKLLYMAELLLIFFIYARKLKRRSHFGWRITAVCAVNMGAAFLFPVLKDSNMWYNSFVFMALFVLMCATAIFCFKGKFINILYCGVVAYTTRHMAFQIFGLTTSGLELLFSQSANDTVHALYGSESFASFISQDGFVWCIYYVAIYAMTCALLFKFFGKHLWRSSKISVENSFLLILAVSAVLVDVVLHNILLDASTEVNVTYLLVYVYNILCCLFIFYMMFNSISIRSAKEELDLVKYLLKIQKENYEEQSRNIELINMRCHDIKHQIHEYLDDDAKKYLNGIENLINIYDSTIKTGCHELDIILMQKKLYCSKNGIEFSCMADGQKLTFMEGSDIYSLFGNIIDNAIESVEKLSVGANKVIDVSVKRMGNILKIQASNYYEGEISFDADGLPMTTKENKAHHGYGVKSVREIVSKYGGDLCFETKDNIFYVYIIMECSKLGSPDAV